MQSLHLFGEKVGNRFLQMATEEWSPLGFWAEAQMDFSEQMSSFCEAALNADYFSLLSVN